MMDIPQKYQDQYARLAPHLGCVDCVLDIGCGTGIMDMFLMVNHGTNYVHLVDGAEHKDKPGYSYSHEETVPWNDVHDGLINVAQCAANLPNRPSVIAYSVNGVKPNFQPEPDLIMSLFSCGFHYPVEVYLDWFLAYPQARVLLDLRVHRKLVDVDGERIMHEAGYQTDALIFEYEKGKRVLFSKGEE